ncbi:GNAT family N-acetyltransferase [Clostridium thermobutyricum]|uniref:GNAT family N-acetyltransferase n=1 Tax=Clostridium thermobutyricum TaxID=29372 RepID=UPI0018AB7548|nr:GNAT family protein [Clostridium thermobutyricum]
MSLKNNVNISLSGGSKTEYIIRDKNNISIGRFEITDMNHENQKCDVKLKFYREDDYNLLRETLELILSATFKDKKVYKVNIIINEGIKLSPFLDIGFILEGIISDNAILNGSRRSDLMFGINREDFRYKNCEPIIKLQGENIYLRNLTPNDSEEILNYYNKNKKHLEKFEPSRDKDFYTLETQQSLLNESYKQFLNGTSYELGIIKDNKIIGKIRLSNIVYGVFKSGILGYSIDEDFQGKGYMKEAVNLIVEYSFNDLDLHRIEASALVRNERSKNVLLGCGFEELGINKKYLFINGIWEDHITFYKVK